MYKTIIEPFRVKMVEPIKISSYQQRLEYLKHAHNNTFLLHSDEVMIDLLTDSGTSAMSTNQWAAMMLGDESYAGARSWEKMTAVIKELTGYKYILPTHQGRAAERILYGFLGGKDKVFLSNTHFDTTRANIEFSGATAIDCLTDEAKRPDYIHPFKGNIDIESLEYHIKQYGAINIAAVILTVTNNSGGGQPVSMQNAKDVKEICDKYNVLFILDACRIAENAYFIKNKEPEYKEKGYKQIAQEMFELADGCIMSAKKDAISNMGGFLALKEKHKKLADECISRLIITEGYVTYGGLSGRDMEAIAIGLEEVFNPDYLTYRIKSTEYLGNKLDEKGVPLMKPYGGHAIYIDAKKFYKHIPPHHYPGQSLVCNLYLHGGIRSCEIGSVMFGKYDDHHNLIPAPMELVRLAIPRRVYMQSHIDYVIEAFDQVVEEKEQAKGMKIVYEPEFLRHFTAHFESL